MREKMKNTVIKNPSISLYNYHHSCWKKIKKHTVQLTRGWNIFHCKTQKKKITKTETDRKNS